MGSTIPTARSLIAMLTATATMLVLVGGASLEPTAALATESNQVQSSTVFVDEAPALGALPNAFSGFDPEDSDLVDRDEYANTYQNSDGTFTVVVSYEPINVRRGGQWVPASDAISHDASGWSADLHPMSPEFANRANGGMTASHGGSEITFRLNDVDNSRINRVQGTDDAVQYDDVIGGADLRYDTEGAAVKETIVLSEAPELGETRWTWDIHAPGLTVAKNEFGDIEFANADGVVQFHIPQPVAWDSSGIDEVQEPASISLGTQIVPNGLDYKLIITVDPQWVFDRARVYPVFIDPSVTAGDTNFRAYKSDGATRTDAVHVGNSRDSGTNKYWRTQAKYSYSGLAGKQVIDASFKAVYVNGTVNAHSGGGIYEAPCLGYSCVGAKLGNVTVGSGNDVVNTNKLAEYYAAAVDTGNFGRYLTSRGAETAGAYTYKQLNTSLTLTYKAFPSISGMNGDSPADGGIAGLTPSLSVAAVDPTGDGVWVRYLVSTRPSFDTSSIVLKSDWYEPTEITIPNDVLKANTTYYWKAQAVDSFNGLYGVSTVRDSVVWSFITHNEAPSEPTIVYVNPAESHSGEIVSSLSPIVGLAGIDDDSDLLTAEVELFDDDGFGNVGAKVDSCISNSDYSGRVMGCGFSALTDGARYHLRARTNDGSVYSDWSAWAKFKASSGVASATVESPTVHIPFDHAVSLVDAVDVMSSRTETVVGYRFESSDVVGEWYPEVGESTQVWLDQFDTEFGTDPAITHVIVDKPYSGMQSMSDGVSMLSHLGELPAQIITTKPIFTASAVTSGSVIDLGASLAYSVQQESVRVASGFSTAESTWGDLAIAPAPILVTPPVYTKNWQPSSANVQITKYKDTAGKDRVKFQSAYYWNGTTRKPTNIDPDFGAEFANDVYGNHYASKALRCSGLAVDLANTYCLDLVADCSWASATSREILVAKMGGASWAVHVSDPSGGTNSQIKKIGAYLDWFDLWDECNRNSMAIGLRNPEKLPKMSGGDFRLYTTIWAYRGSGWTSRFDGYTPSDASDKIGSTVDAVERVSCGITSGLLELSLCMGGNVFVPWSDGNGNPHDAHAIILNKNRKRYGPNLCWKVAKGAIEKVDFTSGSYCAGSW